MLGEVRRRSLAGAETAAVLHQLQVEAARACTLPLCLTLLTRCVQNELQQLKEQLVSSEAEAKSSIHQAEAAKDAAVSEKVAITSRYEQQLQQAQADASLKSAAAAAAAQGLAAANAENAGLRVEVGKSLELTLCNVL